MNPLDALMPAVITSARLASSGPLSGQHIYSWTQQQSNVLTAAYESPLAYRRGVVTSDTVWESPALEVNNASVPVGTNVLLRQRGSLRGTMAYEFAAPPSGGGGGSIPQLFNVGSYSYTITASATWQDATTGGAWPTLTLPAAGTYLLVFTAQTGGQASSLGLSARIEGRLWDITAGAIVPGAFFQGSQCQVVNQTVFASNTVVVPYTVTGPTTIRPEAWRDLGNTWVQSVFGVGGTLGYLKTA